MAINIFGVVGEEVRASDVIKQIQAEKGDVIEVTIMSPGGSVFEGFAIYDALRAASEKGQEIKTSALGMAASIASIIFMAGDVREVSDNAELMVHNSHVVTGGNKHDLEGAIETLDGMDKKMIDIYMSRTDLSAEEVTDLLNKETFMTADEAVNSGFATGKTNAMALVAIHNKQKEPVNMADEKKEDKSMLNKLMAFLKKEIKAEEIPEKEDDAAEEANAEGDDPTEDEPDMAAENKALKAEIAELKAKAESDDDEEKEAKAKAAEDKEKAEHEDEEEKKEEDAKALSLFHAMTDNKVTMGEATNLLTKSPAFVAETLKDKAANCTGLGKSPEPKSEVSSKKEVWTAMRSTDPKGAQAYYKKHSDEIAKEK